MQIKTWFPFTRLCACSGEKVKYIKFAIKSQDRKKVEIYSKLATAPFDKVGVSTSTELVT